MNCFQSIRLLLSLNFECFQQKKFWPFDFSGKEQKLLYFCFIRRQDRWIRRFRYGWRISASLSRTWTSSSCPGVFRFLPSYILWFKFRFFFQVCSSMAQILPKYWHKAQTPFYNTSGSSYFRVADFVMCSSSILVKLLQILHFQLATTPASNSLKENIVNVCRLWFLFWSRKTDTSSRCISDTVGVLEPGTVPF